MKAKVLRKFRDKYTKALHKAGDIIEISNERYEEINSTSHGFLVKEIEDGAFRDYAMKYPLTEEYLNSFTKKELVEHAREKGIELDMRMTKKEMIARLV